MSKSKRTRCRSIMRKIVVVVTLAAIVSGGLTWAFDYERLVKPLLYPKPKHWVPPIF